MHLPSPITTTIQVATLSNATTTHSHPDFEKVSINPELSSICTEILNPSTGNYELKSDDPNCMASKDESFIKRAPSSLEHGYSKYGASRAMGKKFTDYMTNSNQRRLEWTSEGLKDNEPTKGSFIGRDSEFDGRDPSSNLRTQNPLSNAASFQSQDQDDFSSINNMMVGYPGAPPKDANLDSGYYYDSDDTIGQGPDYDSSSFYYYPTRTQSMPDVNSNQDGITYIHPYEVTQSHENIHAIPEYDYTESNSNLKSPESVKTLDENSNPQPRSEPEVAIQTESKITDTGSIKQQQSSTTPPPSTNHQDQSISTNQKVETKVLPTDSQTDDVQDSTEFEELIQDEENEEDE